MDLPVNAVTDPSSEIVWQMLGDIVGGQGREALIRDKSDGDLLDFTHAGDLPKPRGLVG